MQRSYGMLRYHLKQGIPFVNNQWSPSNIRQSYEKGASKGMMFVLSVWGWGNHRSLVPLLFVYPNVWEKLVLFLNLHIPQLPPTSKFLTVLNIYIHKKNERVIWDLASSVVFWEIWREHNYRIFNELDRSTDQSFYICLSFISDYLNLFSGTFRETVSRYRRGHLRQPYRGD